MSITKSYNKHTGIYYAYNTTYVWDEASQRKVQKKVCIGQYDPETGEVIPNAKRGRPSKQITEPKVKQQIKNNNDTCGNLQHELSDLIAEMDEIESSMNKLNERFCLLKKRMVSLCHSVSNNELS